MPGWRWLVVILIAVLLANGGAVLARRDEWILTYCCSPGAEPEQAAPEPVTWEPSPSIRTPSPPLETSTGDVNWATAALIAIVTGLIGYLLGRALAPSVPDKILVRHDVNAAAGPIITDADTRKENFAWLALQKQHNEIIAALRRLGLVP
jgi:hypothetical protein